jgi:hypothetical protein
MRDVREDGTLECLTGEVHSKAGQVLELYGAWQVGASVEECMGKAAEELEEASTALRAYLRRLLLEEGARVREVVADV